MNQRQIFTYLEDFKKNPLSANPYLVVTCFDELVRTKGIALLRGDVLGGMTKDEGQTMMNVMLNTYLVDQFYETVRKFNHEPNQFNYEKHVEDGILEFRQQMDQVLKTKTAPIDIGKARDNPWGLI